MSNEREFKKATFIDLFAGIGGFHFALSQYGAKCVYASDWDKYAQKTYELNFGIKPDGDITKIDPSNIPEFDILCGGFPCQPFSISGKQLGFNDTRGTLFFDIARIISHHSPKILFLENVANLKKHEDGETIKRILEVLESLGYDVYSQVLNASHYGVPQSRKRLYIVGFRKDLGIENFLFPEATNKDIVLSDILDSAKESKKYILTLPNAVINNSNKVPRTLAPVRIGTIGKGSQGDRIYSPNGHAITLSANGGGNAAKTGAYLVGKVIRKLSPNECRKVQGFPDTFKIPANISDSQLWKQFGNSVSVPVLEAITGSITKLPQLKSITKPKKI
jgi:DNA (cytosine-5)-methyltransferase 1